MNYFEKRTDNCLKLICNTGHELVKITIELDADHNIEDASYKVVDSMGDGYTVSDRDTFGDAVAAAEDFISSFGEPVSFVGSTPIHKPK